ncbi:uncharacterized protein B0I36DRAFT_348823 [Microdochium trichocladiopsis]|uniref:Uncharacterized protein n=1 Tax=Microdochium trichocladiopsis TaxID=1682393 RepID=A0A9P8Y8G0_9PEZI|nr:uncharacterized protein B0I36DRAFT_348823 [Microdochium trichocladiopsis]KAH7030615.1 hypothetical protein B0I36DRAFT_348823 [Microdochium trichocladiopsis]
MDNPAFKDWQQGFCPFDAIGFAHLTPSPPSQDDFAKAVRVARFVTDPARIQKAGEAASRLPYTREQVDQAVKYFTQHGSSSNYNPTSAEDELLDPVAWEWAFQEIVVFQYRHVYVRHWAPERLRWDQVVLEDAIAVDLAPPVISTRKADDNEGQDKNDEKQTLAHNNSTQVQKGQSCGKVAEDMTTEAVNTKIATTGAIFEPTTPARLGLFDAQSTQIEETGQRHRFFSTRLGHHAKRHTENDNNTIMAQPVRHPSLLSPTSHSSPAANNYQRPQDRNRNTTRSSHRRVHHTGVILGHHRRQLHSLPAHLRGRPSPSVASPSVAEASPTGPTVAPATTGNLQHNKDYRQAVHSVVDALGRVQRWLRATNMAGELVPREYRLPGVGMIDGASIVYRPRFRAMGHEAINDEMGMLSKQPGTRGSTQMGWEVLFGVEGRNGSWGWAWPSLNVPARPCAQLVELGTDIIPPCLSPEHPKADTITPRKRATADARSRLRQRESAS